MIHRLPEVFRCAAAALCLVAAGCAQAEGPALCLFLANPSAGPVDPQSQSCASVTAAQKAAPLVLHAGKDVFVVRHELPAGIDPPEPLHLKIQPPCGAADQVDVEYGTINDQRVALLTRTAPAGADCSLVVTATIANSMLVAATEADTSTCKLTSCSADASADAGADAASP